MKSFPLRNIPDELHERARKYAFDNRVSINELYKIALKEFLDNRRQEVSREER